MLLPRLIEYARRDGAELPFHRERTFDWELALGLDGRPLSGTVQSLIPIEERGRPRGVAHWVPAAVRTVGVAANLAADDAQYVLGWADEDSKPVRVAQCHAAFVDLTRRWAESDTGRADPVAQAVHAFYRDAHPASIARPEGCSTTVLHDAHRGRAPDGRLVDDPLHRAKFCSLSVGGNVARVVVRDWVEMPLDQVVEHVELWFTDHEIASSRPGGRRHHGIGQFTVVCGRWLRDRKQYANLGAKGADRPDGVQKDLTRAALRDTPVPPSLLAHVVRRVRTDGHLDDTRAALLRLILTRHPGSTEKPMAELDPHNSDPAYVAGRLFELLEQIQYAASDGKLNTTYGDRYFAGAVSNPRAAIVGGRRDAIAWLRKLRRQPAKQGAVIRHEKELDQLFDLVNAGTGIPSRTTLRQQATFLLGYHHQRAHRFAAIEAAKAVRSTTPDEETT